MSVHLVLYVITCPYITSSHPTLVQFFLRAALIGLLETAHLSGLDTFWFPCHKSFRTNYYQLLFKLEVVPITSRLDALFQLPVHLSVLSQNPANYQYYSILTAIDSQSFRNPGVSLHWR